MTANVVRRERLSRFVDLARVYRGWNKAELSEALGRDPTKLVPESGNPKLDLIIGIADALDWTVGDVAESVWREPDACNPEYEQLGYEELDGLALKAHRSGQWKEMLAIGNTMLAKSTNSTQRALAFNRIGNAYDGMGRYANSLKAWQTGLGEHALPSRLRVMLRVNLSNAHYSLWHLVEARAIAGELISTLEQQSSLDRLEKSSNAAARYVRGNTLRRMIIEEPDAIGQLCSRARADLEASQELYLELADEFDDNTYRGVANTCAGALLEVDAASGALDPVEAVRRIEAGLEEVIDPESIPAGDELESWGWWSIFGCNIALRHLEGDVMHRHMAVFTNKAIEIAECLGNWSMRERAFTLEHFRRQQADVAGAQERTWPLDEEDIRTITGTMGRFPSFREVGWQILRGARILDSE